MATTKDLKPYLLSPYTVETLTDYESSTSGDRWVSGTLLGLVLADYTKQDLITNQIASGITNANYISEGFRTSTLTGSTANDSIPQASAVRDYIATTNYTKSEVDALTISSSSGRGVTTPIILDAPVFPITDHIVDVSTVHVISVIFDADGVLQLDGVPAIGSVTSTAPLTILLNTSVAGPVNVTIRQGTTGLQTVVSVQGNASKILTGILFGNKFVFSEALQNT